jgi:gliding motility-associated lipoprotein GldH
MIKPNIRFPLSGKYKMRIKHAMRDEKLNGIEDVGITISKKE